MTVVLPDEGRLADVESLVARGGLPPSWRPSSQSGWS